MSHPKHHNHPKPLQALIFLLLFLSTHTCFAQAGDSVSFQTKRDSVHTYYYSGNLESAWSLRESRLPACPFNVEGAKKDIENQSLKLVIDGAFIGYSHVDEYYVKAFHERYGVNFSYLGCMRRWNTDTEDIQGYNRKILDYLSSKYGKQVRQDYNNIWIKPKPADEYPISPFHDHR